MKKLFLILVLELICSCQPRIENNSETLEKVFAMSDFDIKIQHWGCLGGSEEDFDVTLKNNGFLLESKKTGKNHLVSKIKMDSLKNYLKTKIGKEDYGGCTGHEYIRIGTVFNSIDYEHSHCDGTESTIINDLLGYHDLISENETE